MGYKVTKEFKGSPDGHTVITYKVGDEVDEDEMGADLLKVALDEKWIAKPKSSKADAKAQAEAEAQAKEDADAQAQAEEAARIKAEAIAALQADLDRLNAELTAAADANADTDSIVAQIEAKQAELDALLA